MTDENYINGKQRDYATDITTALWFVETCMLPKLRANAHKDHWAGRDPVELIERVYDEFKELRAESFNMCYSLKPGRYVGEEAADVANFCMMLADEERSGYAVEELESKLLNCVEVLRELNGLVDRIHKNSAIGRPIRVQAKRALEHFDSMFKEGVADNEDCHS